jgi:hypothetical protein
MRDRLQSYVIVGFGEHPECPLPKHRPETLHLKRGESVKIWIRSVFQDDLLKPESQKEIHYTAINDFGEVATGGAAFSGTIITDANGFADLPNYSPTELGVFRLRVDYADRAGSSYSYSPRIIVI